MGIRSLRTASISTGVKRSKVWDQSAVVLTNAYESIATITTGAGGASTVSFTSIPSTYKHLQIRFMGITSRPTYAYDGLYMTLNSDTGANYPSHNVSANGSAAPGSGGGGGGTNIYMDFVMGTTTANYPGVGIIDILDYQNTNKNTTVRLLGGSDANGTFAGYPSRLNLLSGAWLNTAAVNTITFTPVNNNFAQYNQFALYGIKG